MTIPRFAFGEKIDIPHAIQAKGNATIWKILTTLARMDSIATTARHMSTLSRSSRGYGIATIAPTVYGRAMWIG